MSMSYVYRLLLQGRLQAMESKGKQTAIPESGF